MMFKKHVLSLLAGMIVVMLASMPLQASEQDKLAKPLFSLKPLALLYAALYHQNIDSEQVLYPADQNVHDYQLSVNDLRKVQKHQTIIWFGHDVEQPLAKLSKRLTDKVWLEVGNKEHIWLEPAALDSVLQAMIDAAPIEQQAKLTNNKQQLLQRIEQSLSQWKAKFAPFKEQPIIVGHSAFNALLNALDVHNILTYSVGHGHGHGGHHHGGTRKQLAIQKRIQQGDVHCVISEPDLSFDSLSQRFKQLTIVQLEPMATSIALDSKGFEQFLHNNIEAAYNCLATKG